jgi:hypothetical protein
MKTSFHESGIVCPSIWRTLCYFLVVVIVLSWSCRKEATTHNVITFRDKEEQVIDSLRILTQIIAISSRTNGLTDYAVEHDGTLRIGSTVYSDVKQMLSDSTSQLKDLSIAGRERLARLILYLKINHLWGGSWSADSRAWCFAYIDGFVEESDDDRFVFLCENEATMRNIKSACEIVQVKGQLVMAARKGAKIHK